MRYPWPKSLAAQLLVSLALALLAAQIVNAALLYRAQYQQAESQIATGAAVRLIGAADRLDSGRLLMRPGRNGERREGNGRRSRRGMFDLARASPVTGDMRRLTNVEVRLDDYLQSYGVEVRGVQVALLDQPFPVRRRSNGRPNRRELAGDENEPRPTVLAVMQMQDGRWLSVRYAGPVRGNSLSGFLIVQTVVLYLVLLIPMALIIQRVVRPIRDLTREVAAFRGTQKPVALAPRGPLDVRQLTSAFNDMSTRIAGMIREKDVMLGAIGHDLKTPLAALRVRLETVDDETQRNRMVAGVEDINRTLDDILALARIGHPIDPPETVNMTALIETIAEEFVDLGKDVTFADTPRIIVPVHETWMRRAIRNLVGNAIRYGNDARISLYDAPDAVTIRIDDTGPGIAQADIETMFEAFKRAENSRNQATGGSGLGLTLARAIVQQHGGQLKLSNCSEGGLRAEIILPR